MKEVRRLPRAEQDIKDIAWYYAGESMSAVDKFLSEIKHAAVRIGEMPGAGSPRFARDLSIPNLRTYALQDFSYLVFYIEREEYTDVVRVVHSHRDIFNLLLGLD